jgi:hypothetical protein
MPDLEHVHRQLTPLPRTGIREKTGGNAEKRGLAISGGCYKGHAVRKNIAAAFGNRGGLDRQADPWRGMFEQAGDSAASDLEIFWVYPGPAQFERHVPTLALSREWTRLPALRSSLALFRMVFGQPRQDDLLAYLLGRSSAEQLQPDLRRLQIDLSPCADY